MFLGYPISIVLKTRLKIVNHAQSTLTAALCEIDAVVKLCFWTWRITNEKGVKYL